MHTLEFYTFRGETLCLARGHRVLAPAPLRHALRSRIAVEVCERANNKQQQIDGKRADY